MTAASGRRGGARAAVPPPERIRLVMGTEGPRIWWWDREPQHLPEGEVHEYVPDTGAVGPLPVEATEEMMNAGYNAMRDPSTRLPAEWVVLGTAAKVWDAMRRASPPAGSISAEDLERAAEAVWQAESMRASGRPRQVAWADAADGQQEEFRLHARAAFEAAGLTVAPDGEK